MRKQQESGGARSAGMTLVEITIVATILGLVLLIGFGVVVRDNRLSRSTVAIGVAETHAQQMLNALVRQLSDARGESPHAITSAALSATDTSQIAVDTTLGFPDQGILLVDRGTNSVERVLYAALTAGGTSFQTLGRGAQCTQPHPHIQGTEVLWAGLAEAISLSGSPPPSTYDGRAREPEGPVFFRGDGTGFSYRLPTDPSGGNDVLDGGNIRWGAVVGSRPTLSGWAALVFSPRGVVAEADVHTDLNHDGDESDVFDVGQIRMHTWNTADPNVPANDIGLGPPVILQERCHTGGDLDGDGFDDPIFLWEPARRRLHVRLFVLGRSSGEVPAVRKVESMIFLRNEVGT